VVALLIAGFAAAIVAGWAADLVLRARVRARRRRVMSERLAAATARAEEQHQRRQAAAHASRDLTSVIPAIKRPPLSVPGVPPRGAGSPADPPPDGVHRGVSGSS
jgi:type II secretory pathway pseudopilin PulG